jgi:hypothetical protein
MASARYLRCKFLPGQRNKANRIGVELYPRWLCVGNAVPNLSPKVEVKHLQEGAAS